MLEALQSVLNETWSDHPIAGRNFVQIVAAHPGEWDARVCATPDLWIMLVGHYRTFSWTRETWKKIATHSSAGCSMAVAFMPDEIDVPDAERRWWRKRDMKWGEVSSNVNDVPVLMQTARHAFPKLAYAIVRRTGAVSGFPACLALYWHGVWATSHWVARFHRLSINPASVVLRARPDVSLPTPLALERTLHYFQHGERGRHLMFGPGMSGQADVLMLTSFAAYSSDIAGPLEASSRASKELSARLVALSNLSRQLATKNVAHRRSSVRSVYKHLDLARFWWERAHLNGWGYGRSMLNEGLFPSKHRCSQDCLCLNGGTHCLEASCLLTIVEGALTHANKAIVRNAPKSMSGQRVGMNSSSALTLLDPAVGIHCYCPLAHSNQTSLPPNCKGNTAAAKPWGKVLAFLRCPSRGSLAIQDNRGTPDKALVAQEAVWPRGCGDAYHEQITAQASKCFPERFFFSYVDGELPASGFDLIHMHDILNRTMAGSMTRFLRVPPPLAVTPSMLFGTGYTPLQDRDGEERGFLIQNWSDYVDGSHMFKRLGMN
mmetsp:Transcript_8853/g.19603  ORF Transcript_8853/g.19603 Transcript_8853/m.19603 type:complete len:546 (-) Transcript_8853:253-1890(-)